MAFQINISGELTQQVVAAGDGSKVSSISLVNTHASTTCTVDMYVERKLHGKFYLAKSVALPVGVTLVLDGTSFSVGEYGFGLFIKLTQGASETPTVDVMLN